MQPPGVRIVASSLAEAQQPSGVGMARLGPDPPRHGVNLVAESGSMRAASNSRVPS